MASRVQRRAKRLSAAGLSLALHALMLSGLAFGVRLVQPPPEAEAIQVALLPPLASAPEPAPDKARRAPSTAKAAPAPAPLIKPRPIPFSRSPLPPVALPEAQASQPSKPQAAAPPGPVDADGHFRSGLRLKVGCADPDPFHLTPQEQQTCGEKLAEMAKTAKPLDINIPDDKRAEYERATRCRASQGAMPSSAGGSNAAGGIGGLGYVPTLRECPPSSR